MSEQDDAARWEAVEEATELLVAGEPGRALELLRSLIETDPRNPYAYHYAATALFELKQLEPARDALQAAIRLAPRYLAAHVALSHTLRLLREPAGAAAAAAEALRLFPDDADALHAAGLAAAAGGRLRAAREYLERFLQGAPELEPALEVRSMLALMEKRPEGTPFDIG